MLRYLCICMKNKNNKKVSVIYLTIYFTHDYIISLPIFLNLNLLHNISNNIVSSINDGDEHNFINLN